MVLEGNYNGDKTYGLVREKKSAGVLIENVLLYLKLIDMQLSISRERKIYGILYLCTQILN